MHSSYNFYRHRMPVYIFDLVELVGRECYLPMAAEGGGMEGYIRITYGRYGKP